MQQVTGRQGRASWIGEHSTLNWRRYGAGRKRTRTKGTQSPRPAGACPAYSPRLGSLNPIEHARSAHRGSPSAHLRSGGEAWLRAAQPYQRLCLGLDELALERAAASRDGQAILEEAATAERKPDRLHVAGRLREQSPDG